MPLPLGSIVRFSAVLAVRWRSLLLDSTSTSLAKDPPPAISKELLKSKDNSLLRVAEIARDSADYPSAIRLYKTLVQNGDTRPEVHLGLADCLFLTGAYTEAAAEYHAIDEKSPKIADAEVGLGRVFLAQHKPAEANVEFYGALQHLPGDTRALNGAGVALDNLGRHEDARLYYERGIAIGLAIGPCATIMACRWRSEAITPGRCRCCGRWSTNRGPPRATGRTWRSPWRSAATAPKPRKSPGSISTPSR